MKPQWSRPMQAPEPPRLPVMRPDNLALATSESLNQALSDTPEVRPDKVAEAKALVQDGSYPPAVIIRKISALLAIKINTPDQSA
jgi:hypothetical protein